MALPLILPANIRPIDYEIKNSVIFQGANLNSCLYRSYTSGADTSVYKKTFVIRCKRLWNAAGILICNAYTGSTVDQWYIYFDSNANLRVQSQISGSQNLHKITNRQFHDYTNWYDIVVSVDTTLATAEDRVIIEINGVRETSFSTNINPAQNSMACSWLYGGSGTSFQTVLGRNSLETANYFYGFMADIHVVDGQALGAAAFGRRDARTKQWLPKRYTGAYGNNGFHLEFKSYASTTELGYDTSGNNKNFNVNGFNVTPTNHLNCVSKDSPNNNYNWYNGCDYGGIIYHTTLNVTVAADDVWRTFRTTYYLAKGKWYFEFFAWCFYTSNSVIIGIINKNSQTLNGNGSYVGQYSTDYSWQSNATKRNGGTTAAYGYAIPVGGYRLMKCALDFDNGKMWLGDQTYGWWSGDPEAGTSPMWDNIPVGSGQEYAVAASLYGYSGGGNYQGQTSFNFGDRPFQMTVPNGFKTICVKNLPEPKFYTSNDYIDVDLYTGNGAARTRSGFKFSPDLIFTRCRTYAHNHGIVDSSRGINKIIYPSSSIYNEITNANCITAINSDGYSLGTDLTVNANGQNYLAWLIRANNGNVVANNAGSITSYVQANTKIGFSIVKYTGNGSAGATIGHGLGKTPAFIIIKNRTTTNYAFVVFHKSIGATQYLTLDTTNGVTTDSTIWNNTAPNDNVFTVGTNMAVNANGQEHVAYCFAEIEGFSRFDRYLGYNYGIPFVYLGFSPRMVIIKNTASGYHWEMHDTARKPNVENNLHTTVNGINVEAADASYGFYNNSTGIKLVSTIANWNYSGHTFVFAAFMERPCKYANAR